MHSISFALSFTQEFLVGYSSQSQFYTDISKNNLFFHQIVQGVCSCFSLFNLQGTPPTARGSFAFAFVSLADSSDIIPCIPPFVKHFFRLISIFFVHTISGVFTRYTAPYLVLRHAPVQFFFPTREHGIQLSVSLSSRASRTVARKIARYFPAKRPPSTSSPMAASTAPASR